MTILQENMVLTPKATNTVAEAGGPSSELIHPRPSDSDLIEHSKARQCIAVLRLSWVQRKYGKHAWR